ncbi:MAG: hypothetical protein KIS67_22230 [Verrucomicrobiae bacterium]|nr:hypothetical protein [Verrucomicrobiae bacterium]
MLDPNHLDGMNFKQRADACVLASYSVAAYAFTRIPVQDYFNDYCKHYGIAASDPEVYYAGHFHGEWNRLKVPGYRLIQSLYETSAQPSFSICRAVFAMRMIENVRDHITQVEGELRSPTKNVLAVFLNQTGHSITVAFEPNGPYKYDVNVGQIERGFKCLADLGDLGSGFLLSAR